jgi:GNAT superfamily N-acetyltransferase
VPGSDRRAVAAVELATLTAADEPPVELVLPVYAEVYAEAPYLEGPAEVEDFARSWPARVAAPGFRLVLASDEGHVVGFAFGHGLRPDTGWWSGALEPLEVDTAEWPGRTFAVIELAVLAGRRRQGLGRRLHSALLAGVEAERVTLAVRPEPETAHARAMYERWAYRRVGQVRPGPGLPVYDVMVAGLGSPPQ